MISEHVPREAAHDNYGPLARYIADAAKELPANSCHEMLVGELGSPLNKHLKVKRL